jgi:DNA-binding response OmpR family regulator
MNMTLSDEVNYLRAENQNLKSTIANIASDQFRIDGEDARMTANERKILSVLHSAIGKVVAHRVIYNAVYHDRPDGGPMSDIVKVYVAHLRKKLQHHRIVVDWGIGYRLEKIRGE